MNSPLREQFILVTMRFKRIEIVKPSESCLQQSELAVMARAFAGGECGICASDIQQNLHISKPAVSQTLNSLERKGYITRAIDPDDRRKITVQLTPEGEHALCDARCCYEKSADRVLERFGAENAMALLELINRLMDILEENE